MFYPVIVRNLPSPSLGRYLIAVLAFLLSNTALAEDKGLFDIGKASVTESRRLPHPPAKLKGRTPVNLSACSSRVATQEVNVRGSETTSAFAELHTRLEALEAAAREKAVTKKGLWDIGIGGYGEFAFAYHDYGPDQTKKGGALSDNRLVFDTKRFTFGVKGEMDYDIEFEVEVEIEHGGTGSALELEFEEFGEFESEVERGGEVALEELYLEKKIGNWAVLAGRFNVAVGLLPKHHRPSEFLGSSRPESETTVIPAVWDEIGVEVHYSHPWFRATAQLVNGLDSTGFSSQRWIATGHQQRFELVRATDVAVVGRVDIQGVDGLEFGVSTYLSANTTNNRPKPDLKGLKAPIAIVSTHLLADIAPVRARASLVWGHLSNSAAISDRNSRLSNNLDVLRTSVAKQAISFWSEFGFDVFHHVKSVSDLHRLEPFVRVEYYDTMYRVNETVFDNPRFARTILSGGLGYTFHDSVVVKLDYSHRRLGSGALRNENTAALAAGFEF